ncbi:hypothetical protein HELRODRAFT_162471 [Helobdella robusta]|uniref:Uncharacterized protein n=1 Tax=Helobdella robusta TaxID=6412 RepID=T1ESQ1_HELRO|nr:hypothetical protein HELRODRAFT_162471 [Helobdella robusta]ESN98996.1 hypothetical protein HELRODRAFT_162471 [Helobdella robusta]
MASDRGTLLHVNQRITPFLHVINSDPFVVELGYCINKTLKQKRKKKQNRKKLKVTPELLKACDQVSASVAAAAVWFVMSSNNDLDERAVVENASSQMLADTLAAVTDGAPPISLSSSNAVIRVYGGNEW